tara:strand:- start:82 stop:939 length:858 start_codon:yes stop_codon:yes gene_type:complete
MYLIATIESVEEAVTTYLGDENWNTVLRITALVLIALPAVYILSSIVGRISRKRLGEHIGLLLRKIIRFVGIIAVIVSILLELGFNLGALLGAAGVASVAIGFAAQTSLSNIISGIFIYWEKPFEVGDVIRIGDTSGVVLSIDLLSVKLRQFDNQFVRIPNETMIKAQVTTVTKFPIRRVDLDLGVAYDSNIDHVTRVLTLVAEKNPRALDDPKAVIFFKGFGDSSLNFMLGVWCERTQFIELKNSILRDIKEAFDAEGIEIPFPQRVVHITGDNKPSNEQERSS